MLQLKNISKTYKNGDYITTALNNVNLTFEKNEFVSVLGGSGCGKSTLLNIIGGLMDSSYGELFINDYSTKNYKSTDWDCYRNHYIGFVFQSYHLIPHLNIIENVELTLSLAGLPREEKHNKAMAALEQVGLVNQAKKKPNQLSNGQIQRVAIARAIVHDPEIILADEPTGALDSHNSKQVMELLSRISNNKLVIMVTHNENLAYEYSTRIIKIADGSIVSDEKNTPATFEVEMSQKTIKENELLDTNIFASEEKTNNFANTNINASENENTENNPTPKLSIKKNKKSKLPKKVKVKPSMSFFSAIKLSLKNLSSKLGRTIMTVVAGAIAIISVALVLGFNNGFNNYVVEYEKQSLAQYPITVQKSNSTFTDVFKQMDDLENFDPSSINISEILSVLTNAETTKEEYSEAKEIYTTALLGLMLKSSGDLTKDNNTTLLKEYLDENLDNSLGFVKYDYDISPNVYTLIDGVYTQLNPFVNRLTTGLESLGATINESMRASLTSSLNNLTIWEQMPSFDIVKSQYDLIGGDYPSGENSELEIMLVVDKYNSLNDYALYALGLIEMPDLFASLLNPNDLKTTYKFNELIGKEYSIMLPANYYNQNEETGYYYKITDENELNTKIEETALKVKIKGILRQKEGVATGCLKGTLCFSEDFAKYCIEQNALTPVVLAQIAKYNEYLQDYNNPEITDKRYCKIYSVFNGSELTVNINDTSSKNYFVLLKNDLHLKDVNSPEYIYIYASNVEAKGAINKCIDNYNSLNPTEKVSYTDESTAIVNSLTSTVSTITYILIAVTLIAVVVALFMIAILMYSTVQDRTQEIGILRSIGARKLDIMRIFNVESILLGLFASIIGIIMSLILALPINAVLKSKIGIDSLISPTWWHALALIGFSVVLTLISGLIPALIASKKDPVVALKSE